MKRGRTIAMYTEQSLSGLKHSELKEECRSRGLKVSGRKSELVERILENDKSTDGETSSSTVQVSNASVTSISQAPKIPTTINTSIGIPVKPVPAKLKSPQMEMSEHTRSSDDEEVSLESMKVVDLRDKCRELGLKVSGTKKELIARIENPDNPNNKSIKKKSYTKTSKSERANISTNVKKSSSPPNSQNTSNIPSNIKMPQTNSIGIVPNVMPSSIPMSNMPGVMSNNIPSGIGNMTSMPSIKSKISSGIPSIMKGSIPSNMPLGMSGMPNGISSGISNLQGNISGMPGNMTSMKRKIPNGMPSIQNNMSNRMNNHMQNNMPRGLPNNMTMPSGIPMGGMPMNNMPSGMSSKMPSSMPSGMQNIPSGMGNMQKMTSNMPSGMSNNMPSGIHGGKMPSIMPSGMSGIPSSMSNNFQNGISTGKMHVKISNNMSSSGMQGGVSMPSNMMPGIKSMKNNMPSIQSGLPSGKMPSNMPSGIPSNMPNNMPSNLPSSMPSIKSKIPNNVPGNIPSSMPSNISISNRSSKHLPTMLQNPPQNTICAEMHCAQPLDYNNISRCESCTIKNVWNCSRQKLCVEHYQNLLCCKCKKTICENSGELIHADCSTWRCNDPQCISEFQKCEICKNELCEDCFKSCIECKGINKKKYCNDCQTGRLKFKYSAYYCDEHSPTDIFDYTLSDIGIDMPLGDIGIGYSW